MKTITTILLTLGVITAAHAQSSRYSNAVARGEFCSSMGGIARVTFEGKQKGDPKEKFLKMAASQLDAGDRSAEMLRFAIDYGYDQAADAKDAHMKAWANCMDRTN